MTNDNETVKQVCDKSLRNILDTFGKRVCIFDDIADEIEAAHKREMEAKDAENARLRALVKELTDKLASISERGLRCDKCEFDCDNGCVMYAVDALIARAREEVKDGE